MMDAMQTMRAYLETSWVRRWHTMPESGHPETTGHHMYQVAMFILTFKPEDPSLELVKAALTHDRHERWSGDIPSPGRRAVPQLQTGEDVVQMRCDELFADDSGSCLEPHELAWLRLADASCAWYWCVHQKNLGNMHVMNAYEGCLNGLKAVIRENEKHFVDPESLQEAIIMAATGPRLPESIQKFEETFK